MQRFAAVFVLIMLLATTAAVAADWPLHRSSLARLGKAGETLDPPLSLAWQFHTEGKIESSPAISGNTVYFGSNDGFVYAVDATSGALKWRYDDGGGATTNDRLVMSSPCVDNGQVYVSTYNGHLLALDATTGALVWDYAYGGQNMASPVASGGFVYCGTGYPVKSIFAVRASDGQKVWECPTLQYVHSSPAVVGGKVYIGANDGNMRALDAATGAVSWSYSSNGGMYLASPAVDNGKVFFAPGGWNRRVYALNTSGAWQWEYGVAPGPGQTTINVSSPAVSGTSVYIVAGNPKERLFSLDSATGAKRWEFEVGPTSTGIEAFASSPVVSGSTVYVGSWDGTVYGIDATAGTQKWSYKLPGGIGASPAVANGSLYVGCTDGTLYAFSPAAKPMVFTSPTDFVHTGWNLVSLPGIPTNPDPVAVFAGYDIGNSSFQYWRNDVEGGGYQIYGDSFGWKGPMQVGIPYWLLNESSGYTISFSGTLIATDQVLTIPAHAAAPYWFMFSHPLNHRTPCTSVRFSTAGSPTPVDWPTAYANHIVESTALTFEATTGSFVIVGPGTQFVDRDCLEPWYGYWLLADSTDETRIHIPAAPVQP